MFFTLFFMVTPIYFLTLSATMLQAEYFLMAIPQGMSRGIISGFLKIRLNPIESFAQDPSARRFGSF